MNKNIVLIGFMGSGKSMVAKALAKRLGRDYISTDEIIETREGMPINDIFKAKGEAHFRRLESEIVKDFSSRKNIIIDCGGGVVLNPENLKFLKTNGIVFHLKATPEVIYERLKGESNRPLLNVPNPLGALHELYNQRLPLYNQADVVVDASDPSIEVVIVEILKRI